MAEARQGRFGIAIVTQAGGVLGAAGLLQLSS